MQDKIAVMQDKVAVMQDTVAVGGAKTRQCLLPWLCTTNTSCPRIQDEVAVIQDKVAVMQDKVAVVPPRLAKTVGRRNLSRI